MISTHVLDISIGKPAANIPVSLDFQEAAESWTRIFSGHTNLDGRISEMASKQALLVSGIYRLTFLVKDYFSDEGFYPSIQVTFNIKDSPSHYHVPILISPYGYSTYRGS